MPSPPRRHRACGLGRTACAPAHFAPLPGRPWVTPRPALADQVPGNLLIASQLSLISCALHTPASASLNFPGDSMTLYA